MLNETRDGVVVIDFKKSFVTLSGVAFHAEALISGFQRKRLSM
jgi:hypothetical protein